MTVDRSRLPEVGDDPSFVFPRIAHHRLTNGLALRTVEHDSAPVITMVLTLEGGAGADSAGREGLGALTADMLDEGSGALSALDVADALARVGGDYDVEVGADVTMLSLTTLTWFAEQAASLFADIVTRPSLRAADFERVRQLRLDRLRQLKDMAPATAERAFLRLLYGTHPYGHLAIGDEQSLATLTLDDVERCHREQYTADRATLVVTGAMSHGQLASIAERAFGGWAARATAAPDVTPASSIEPPPRAAHRLVIVPRDSAAQSELRIGHLSARRDTPDYPALLVMNSIMGGQFVSRVNLKLREEKGYTYGARTGFDWRRGVSPFVLQAGVHTAVTADAVRDSLQELAAIRDSRPPSDGELVLAKASLTRGYPRNFETAQQVARSVAHLALFGLPDSYFEEFVPRVRAVSGADVTSVASRYIEPGNLLTLIVGDSAAIRDSLTTLGLGEAEVMAPPA